MNSETLQSQASQSREEATVRALYTQLMEGWNQGSGEAFAAPFAEDGHLVGFDGMHFKSRDEIVSFHQLLFDKWLKGTRLVGEVESVCFLIPEPRRRPDPRARRDCDAREITAVAGTGLDSDAHRYQARWRMAPRRIPEYEGQAHEPQRSEHFPLAVHGLAMESAWSKEVNAQSIPCLRSSSH